MILDLQQALKDDGLVVSLVKLRPLHNSVEFPMALALRV